MNKLQTRLLVITIFMGWFIFFGIVQFLMVGVFLPKSFEMYLFRMFMSVLLTV